MKNKIKNLKTGVRKIEINLQYIGEGEFFIVVDPGVELSYQALDLYIQIRLLWEIPNTQRGDRLMKILTSKQ